jgi:hypothetical protein
MGVSGQCHAPAALHPQQKDPDTHWIGGWVGPRADLDTEATGKIQCLCWGIEPRSPGHPARRQTLYWLSYPSSLSKLGDTEYSYTDKYYCCMGIFVRQLILPTIYTYIYIYLMLLQNQLYLMRQLQSSVHHCRIPSDVWTDVCNTISSFVCYNYINF